MTFFGWVGGPHFLHFTYIVAIKIKSSLFGFEIHEELAWSVEKGNYAVVLLVLKHS
jgi:hypothetical protein